MMNTLSFLANHLWQSTAFAAVAALLTLTMKENRAETRFWVFLAASLKFIVPLSLAASISSYVHWPASVPAQIQSGILVAVEPFTPSPTSVSLMRPVLHSPALPAQWLASWPAVFIMVWLCGFLVVTSLSYRSSRRVRALARRAKRLVAGPEVEIMERLSRDRGLSRPVPIFESADIAEPGLFRIVQPVLLLPANVGRQLDRMQLETIIAHELSHARRRDNLWAAAHRFVEGLFWFHPMVWWLGNRLVDERERACDEEVLQQGFEREAYAEAMVRVCELCLSSPFKCVAGIRGSDLKRRIEAVMMKRTSLHLSYSKKAILVGAAVVPILSSVLAGSIRLPQVPAVLAFEAASVKPTSPRSGITWGSCHGKDSSGRGGWIASRILAGMSPPAPPALGRCAITRASLKQIVQEAYDLRPTVEITGGPGWFDSDRFDIDAKAEDPSKTNDAQLHEMLQQLLADRFKLKFHRETREMSGSLLVVERDGTKLKEWTDPDNVHPIGGRPGDMIFRGALMSQFAEFLSALLGRPVEDRTGLTGRYGFTLKWSIGNTELAPPEFAQPPDPSGPSLVTALQEQLGLRLQSAKVPVNNFVIDSAEKPSPN